MNPKRKVLAIDPSIISLGWAILEPPKKLKEDEVQINQDLYYCDRCGQLETYNEIGAERANTVAIYLKKNTVMKAMDNGEFQGGGRCTSLNDSWYTTDGLPQLLYYGTVKCKTAHLPSETRMNTTITGLENAVCNLDKESTVVIEKPQLWGAYKSVASMHSGDLLGLHLLVGALYWWAVERFESHRVYLIPVSEWKGQLPKKITQKRMEKRYGVKFSTDDEADACGLGTHYLTHINDLPF